MVQIERTIRPGQYWTDGSHEFRVVESVGYEWKVEYTADNHEAYFMEGAFEDFTPL